MEEQPGIIAQLQPIVLQVVGHIFSQSVMGEKRASLTKGDFCCNGLSTTVYQLSVSEQLFVKTLMLLITFWD